MEQKVTANAEVGEDNLWVLGADGVPRPELDTQAWNAWWAEHKRRLSLKMDLGRGWTLGARFTGKEIGINQLGDPFLYQMALFHNREAMFEAKFPGWKEMDFNMLKGEIQRVLRDVFEVSWWRRTKARVEFVRWRQQTGGWEWKHVVRDLLWRKKSKACWKSKPV
jgi:hypothetical protein